MRKNCLYYFPQNFSLTEYTASPEFFHQGREMDSRMISRGHYFWKRHKKTLAICVRRNFGLNLLMKNPKKLTIKDLKLLSKARSIEGYKFMSRLQLEGMFTRLSTCKPTSEPASKLKKNTSTLLGQLQDPKNVHLCLSQNLKNLYLPSLT